MSSNPEEPEQLTADDMAWSNMSYSERLVWWVNNKVLSKPAEAQINNEQTQTQGDAVVQNTVERTESENVQTVEGEETEQAVEAEIPVAESANESPVKKRSSKGKKINISLE